MGIELREVLNSGSVENSQVPAVETVQLRRFGVFELDLRTAELRRNGSKIKLQEQPFLILELLLARAGEVVSREEIRTRLWPQDTFVDFDHSLNAAIRRLRDALGDTAENPRFIETVARRGYRFVAPVDVVPQTLAPEPAITPALPSRRRYWKWAAAGVVLTAALAAGWLAWRSRPAPDATTRITQLTANPADDRLRAAAISPDGRYLAFADEVGLYLRLIDGGETHALWAPKGFVVAGISWFPNGAHLAVALSRSGEPSSLWDISVLGGSARQLHVEGLEPVVSPDGACIAFLKGSKIRQQLWIMNADGSQPRQLAGKEGDYFGQIAWSPDSQRLAYARGTLRHGYGIRLRIELYDVNSGGSREITSPTGLNFPLAWTSSGRLIYSRDETSPQQSMTALWSLPMTSSGEAAGPAKQITWDTGAVTNLSASVDGKRMVMLKGISQPDVYVAKLEGPGLRLGPPRRLTMDDRRDFPFDWSPDGKEIIFASDRSGRFSIYRQPLDRTVPEVMVAGKETLTLARLSPDGSQLLYLRYPSEEPFTRPVVALMRVPRAGGPPQVLIEAGGISNQQCARAPATVCVYSEVNAAGLGFFTFDPIKGKGRPVLQVDDPLTKVYNWGLSPDGTTLAIMRGRASDGVVKIRLRSLESGADRWLTLTGVSDLSNIDWAADGRSLWTASSEDEQNALLNIDLAGHVREVWRPERLTVGWAIPSRDGRSLALQVSSGSANAWLLEKF
jgi:Tol biopolymer transport system component/DNA-binding winged helix-turn-helix (wHTH) protein